MILKEILVKASELRTYFKAVVATIPRAKRLQLETELAALADHLGIEDDLTRDRRKLTWGPDGPARKTVEARKPYLISYRQGGSFPVSLAEAARLCRTTKGSIAGRISRGGGVYSTIDKDDDIITVTRLDEL